METAAEVHELLNRMHENVWALTALAVVLGDDPGGDPELLADARRLLVELDLMAQAPGGPVPTPGLAEILTDGPANLASEAAAPVLQCAALLASSAAWTDQDDSALVAQARASARAAAPFKEFVVPALEGLTEILDGESPKMLDVGVGVAAMAVEYCRVFPNLRVVGLDVFPRALELARGLVERSGMGARIELRHQDVTDLEDDGVFGLAWLPAPFVPRVAIEAGLPRMATALEPGGWLVIGHGKFNGDGLATAVTRLKTRTYGGTPLDNDEARELLCGAGLEQVSSLPTPQGAPGITVGRRRAGRSPK